MAFNLAQVYFILRGTII